jgi:hypothetical protein
VSNGDGSAVCNQVTDTLTCTYTDYAHSAKSDSYSFQISPTQPPGTYTVDVQVVVDGVGDASEVLSYTILPSPPGKATGGVNRAINGVTGHVSFTAQGTTAAAKGELVYQDSAGHYLHGVVDCYRQVDAKTAVFSGTFTDASPNYSPNPGVFYAAVIDNGTSGTKGPDEIAVLANDPTFTTCEQLPSYGGPYADVTGGNLDVH